MTVTTKISLALLATLESLGVAYLVLVTWLLSGWFVDDFQAARMTESDWWQMALVRIFWGLVVGVVAGTVVLLVNRLVARIVGAEQTRVPLVSAVTAFVLITTAAVVGAVGFAIEKPFM